MTYHKDKDVRIDYNINIIADGIQSKIIGQTNDDIREFPYAEYAGNIVWVDSTLGDDYNLIDLRYGTFNHPVKTLKKATTLCNGTDITIVCIKDSATYTERIESGGVRELWAYNACTPTIIIKDDELDSFITSAAISNIATVSGVNIENKFSCGICRPLSNDGTLLIYNLNGSTDTFAFRRIRSNGTIESSADVKLFEGTGRVLGGVVTDNDNIVLAIMGSVNEVVWGQNVVSNSYYICIYKSDFTLITKFDVTGAPEIANISITTSNFISLTALSNNRFCYSFKDRMTLKYLFKVFDATTGIEIFNWKEIDAHELITEYDSGNIIVYSQIPSDGKRLKTYSTTNGALTNSFSIDLTLPMEIKRLRNGNFVFLHGSYTSLYNSSFNLISGLWNYIGDNTTYGNYRFNYEPVNGDSIKNVSFFSNITELNTGDYIVGYAHSKPSMAQCFSYAVFNGVTGATLGHKLLLSGRKDTNSRAMCSVVPFDNDNFLYYIQSDNASTASVEIHVGVESVIYKSHVFNNSILLNNIKFSGNNSKRITKLINIISNASAQIQYCEFLECVSSIPSKGITAITTNGALTFLQSIIFGTGTGIKATSNNVDISYSQLYRCLSGYAVDITGAGAGIKINHCDIIRNYGGVKLTSNTGGEIIKNSNFGFNAIYDVYAQVLMTFSNSVSNGNVLNCSGGALIKANPLYVNDGAISYADVDFNLRRVVSGYPYDSPACGLADDGDAGSIDIDFSDIVETKESITIKKPKKIDKIIKPVNPTSVTLANGNVKSHNYAWSEELIFSYDEINILDSDMQKIKLLLLNPKSTVRIYLDPVSNPLSYSTYTMIYDPFKTSPELYSFSGLGGKGSQLKFIRQFEG